MKQTLIVYHLVENALVHPYSTVAEQTFPSRSRLQFVIRLDSYSLRLSYYK